MGRRYNTNNVQGTCRDCGKSTDVNRIRQDGTKYYQPDLRKNYNLSLSDWNKMFEKQNGCCAICHLHQSKLPSRLCVDHCHTTGKVRGLLCTSCNMGLGHFRDDETILESAINYLREV
jgi:hypothetical protein